MKQQDKNRRPYFNKIVRHNWTRPGHPDVRGIALIGLGGYSAHLTPSEAIELANRLHDLVEALETEQPERCTA